jgi:outer membrane protein assembly factor BamE (lipoprotein component of BamABCDE complex)
MIARLALVLFLLLPVGCFFIYIPDPGRADTRGSIDDRDLRPFTIGVTTREEVLLALGEPDLQSKDGSSILYWWYYCRGFVAVLAYGAADAGMDGNQINLILKFDDAGRVLRHKFVHVHALDGPALRKEGLVEW